MFTPGRSISVLTFLSTLKSETYHVFRRKSETVELPSLLRLIKKKKQADSRWCVWLCEGAFVPWGQTPPRRQGRRTWCESWGQCRWRIWRRRCCRRPAGRRPRWSCFWRRRCRAPWWPCKRSNIKWSSPRSPWTRNNVTKYAAGSLAPPVCTAASRRRLRTSSENHHRQSSLPEPFLRAKRIFSELSSASLSSLQVNNLLE